MAPKPEWGRFGAFSDMGPYAEWLFDYTVWRAPGQFDTTFLGQHDLTAVQDFWQHVSTLFPHPGCAPGDPKHRIPYA
eukprot:11272508-Alexandrium_andersonii.AAC.1